MRYIWEFHRKKVLLSGILLALVVITFFGFRIIRSRPHAAVESSQARIESGISEGFQSLQSQIARAAEEGNWEEVERLIFKVRKLAEEDRQFVSLVDELMTPLDVKTNVHYIVPPGRSKRKSGMITLTKGDEYWLELTINEKAGCFLYVFEHTSSGRLKLLFPNSMYSPLDNPVELSIRIPKRYETFKGDEPGTHTIFALASRWQQKQLEELVSGGLEANKNEILAMLESAGRYTMNIGGLTVGKTGFKVEQTSSGTRSAGTSL